MAGQATAKNLQLLRRQGSDGCEVLQRWIEAGAPGGHSTQLANTLTRVAHSDRPGALELALKHLEHPVYNVREEAMDVLRVRAVVFGEDEVHWLVESPYLDVRMESMEILFGRTEEASLPAAHSDALRALARDDDPQVRAEMAESVGQWYVGGYLSVMELLDVLPALCGDDHPLVVEEAAWSIGRVAPDNWRQFVPSIESRDPELLGEVIDGLDEHLDTFGPGPVSQELAVYLAEHAPRAHLDDAVGLVRRFGLDVTWVAERRDAAKVPHLEHEQERMWVGPTPYPRFHMALWYAPGGAAFVDGYPWGVGMRLGIRFTERWLVSIEGWGAGKESTLIRLVVDDGTREPVMMWSSLLCFRANPVLTDDVRIGLRLGAGLGRGISPRLMNYVVDGQQPAVNGVVQLEANLLAYTLSRLAVGPVIRVEYHPLVIRDVATGGVHAGGPSIVNRGILFAVGCAWEIDDAMHQGHLFVGLDVGAAKGGIDSESVPMFRFWVGWYFDGRPTRYDSSRPVPPVSRSSPPSQRKAAP